MDTKFLFLIGLTILILSTCSINPTPAEGGIDRQAKTVTVCPTSQQVEGCLIHLP
jgi:hypothetical protein